MKTLITGAAMALMLSGTAFAAEFEWDTNADGQLDEAEFRAGLETDGVFNTWDEDGDGALSQDEFDAGLWDSLDTNEDEILNEPEGVSLEAMRTGWEVDQP